jgi:hypothetical protein
VKWFMRGCQVCGGDLHQELDAPDEVTCLMCGRTFPLEFAEARLTSAQERRMPLTLAPVGEARWRGAAAVLPAHQRRAA